MAPREIKTVGVVATGVIGSSFIALFLARGLKVLACSTSAGAEERLATYLENIWPSLDAITLSPGASLTNYKFVGKTLDGYYSQVDFIQENGPESLPVKEPLLAALDAGALADVVIASSSSGFPSSRFIKDCKAHPERILIGHPFNPPHLIPLIEVVPHPGTSAAATDQAMAFYRSLGKKPILVRQEVPGFVANRLQCALVAEAHSLVMRGVASAEEIDTCITEALGLRWAFSGPYMTGVLGGGGGRDGFRKLTRYILPAAKFWAEDMQKHAFDFDPQHVTVLDASVQEMLEKQDPEAFNKQRDRLLTDLIKAKEDAFKTA